MKNFRNAFTLAEVLIALAVIGVVAAVTLPTLSVNVQKQQVGPSLAKAINTLQNANDLALQAEGVRTLDQLTPDDKTKYFEAGLKNRVDWTEAAVAKPYTEFDDKTKEFKLDNVKKMYVSKDGIAFMLVEAAPSGVGFTLNPLTKKAEHANYNMYSYQYYTVYVDINGNNKGPNVLGKDLFCLWVDTKGSVIPEGGAEWKGYGDVKTAKKIYVGDTMLAVGEKKKTYPHNCPYVYATECAGLVVDSGYKVTYY